MPGIAPRAYLFVMGTHPIGSGNCSNLASEKASWLLLVLPPLSSLKMCWSPLKIEVCYSWVVYVTYPRLLLPLPHLLALPLVGVVPLPPVGIVLLPPLASVGPKAFHSSFDDD